MAADEKTETDSESSEQRHKTSAPQTARVQKTFTWGRVLPAFVLAGAIFALYNYYSVQQLKHWITPSWDLAIFTQMAQSYANFQMPIVQIKGPDFNLWGDHFHPILMLLGPVYALFPSPLTLLVVQNFMVAFSVYLIVRFTQRAFALTQLKKPEPLGTGLGILLGAALGLSYGVQQAVAAQFHEVAFALPLLSGALGNLVLAGRVPFAERSGYLLRTCLWAAPLVFVKEDMGVSAAMIGMVALARSGWIRVAVDALFPIVPEPAKADSAGTDAQNTGSREESIRERAPFRDRLGTFVASWVKTRGAAEATLLILWGFFWSYAAVAIILPYFNVEGQFDYADKVDVYAAISDPLGAFITLFNHDEKVWTILLLLFSGAILWVASPLTLILLPTLLWRLLSGTQAYWASTWHYSLVLMPVVFYALLDVVLKMRFGKVTAHPTAENAALQQQVKAERSGTRAQAARKTSDADAQPDSGGWAESLRQAYRRVPLWFLPAIALCVSVIPTFVPRTQQPLAQLTNPAFTSHQLTASETARMQAIEAVPQNVSVAADLSTLTQLIPHRTVFWIGHTGEPAPDYVVIDGRSTSWNGKPPQDIAQYAADKYGHPYESIGTYGSVEVVRKVS